MSMRRTIFAALAAALAISSAHAQDGPAIPAYVEETATAGLDTSYEGEWDYMVGGGVGVFDCNADGYADVLLPGGAGLSSLYVNASTQGGPLRFEPAPESGATFDAVLGSYPLDVDSDGTMDLIVLRLGENVALRGLGECRFERANEAWGFDGGAAWSAAFAATWERGAQWPTVAVGNYIDPAEELSPWGSCTDNWLHRPDAGGQRFAAPVPLQPSHCALSMLFTDWNRSGTPALRISNDREYYEGGQEQMWRIEPGAEPALYADTDGWRFLRIWGMGIASYDLDNDRFPEYFLTSMADNKLQKLADPAGEPMKAGYADIAFAKGVTAHRPYFGEDLRPSTAWHAQFDDVNNDGLVDLFVAKGNVAEMPDFAMADPNNLLLQGAEGKFIEAGLEAGIATNRVSRGGALADFNMDGLLDLVVTNRWTGAQVWRNTGAGSGNWLGVMVKQPGINPDAAGAWIEVTRGDAVMRREMTVGGGHAGGQAGWWHWGLGEAATASVTVSWPDGGSSSWTGLDANGFYLLERDKPAEPFTPRS
jgi:enediyne biosynthesis protein E4